MRPLLQGFGGRWYPGSPAASCAALERRVPSPTLRSLMRDRPGRLALALACWWVPTAPAWAQTASGSSPLYPTELGTLSSVAGVVDATALGVNPAALAFQSGSEAFLSRSLWGSAEATNLFLAGPSWGSSWQQLRHSSGYLNAFNSGAAWPLGYGLAVGGRLGLLQGLGTGGGAAPDLGLGLLLRPSAWFSAGLALDHLTQPALGASPLARRYRLGMALRPLGPRLTLNADLGWREGDPWLQAQPWAGLTAEPWPGLWLRASGNLQGEASLGMGVELGHLASGLMVPAPGLPGAGGGQAIAYARTTERRAPRPLPLGPEGLAYFRLEGDLSQDPSWWSFGEVPQPGVLALTQALARAGQDPKVTGVVLHLGTLSLGMGRLQELREAILAFKATKKSTLAYLSDGSLGSYYLACAADTIAMHPGGALDVKGFASTDYFLRGLLDKLGVVPQFVGVGRFKSAPEAYERGGRSEASREQDEALLDAMFGQVVGAIAQARRRDPAEIRRVIDRAILTPQLARELGLIDQIAYPDEVPALAKAPGAWAYRLEPERVEVWGEPDQVALVLVDGPMARGVSSRNLLQGASVGSDTIARTLRALREDARVKAVVVRVESPGGDALAADEMGRELDLLRLAGKVVVISMGDVAASGGYWIAANGTRIFAMPGTITGSIGVFSGYFATAGLMAKLGVVPETLRRGLHADMDEGHRLRDAAELDLLRDQARHTYGQFLARVAKGRRMEGARVDAVAQGRVWAGAQAQALGLVDELGGLEAALAEARRLAKLDPARSVLELYPKPLAPWELGQDSGMEGQLRRTAQVMRQLTTPHTWLMAPPLPQLGNP